MVEYMKILKWDMLWKKEELKFKKIKMKTFNFLSKIAIACKILSKKSQSFLTMKIKSLFGSFFKKLNIKPLFSHIVKIPKKNSR